MKARKRHLRETEEVGFHCRQNGIQELSMISIVAAHEGRPLINIHRNTALSDQARLCANVLQSEFEDVRQLSMVVLLGSLQSKISRREHILALPIEYEQKNACQRCCLQMINQTTIG